MKKLSIGDVTIISIIERDGPWRTPREMFPAYDPINGKRHLAELDPEVLDKGPHRAVRGRISGSEEGPGGEMGWPVFGLPPWKKLSAGVIAIITGSSPTK